MASDSSDCSILSALVSNELVNARLCSKETKKNRSLYMSVCVNGDRKAASRTLSHLALVYFLCSINWKARPKRALKWMFSVTVHQLFHTQNVQDTFQILQRTKTEYKRICLEMIWTMWGVRVNIRVALLYTHTIFSYISKSQQMSEW